MRIATWNVNSIRARIDRVCSWLDTHPVDVLALQETKCKDSQFPFERFSQLGYEVAHWGINQWNGVALVSRVGLDNITRGFTDQPGFDKTSDHFQHTPEPRAISAICGGIHVWSIYVPNGREIDDPHYAYKNLWLENFFSAITHDLTTQSQMILCGDWNIAPEDQDVWDRECFEGKTHVTEQERQGFFRFIEAGFVDPVREHTPGEYTYWDYRDLRFVKNEGMRIDFTLASPALAPYASGGMIDREERKNQGASDHAPVIVTFDLPTH